MLPGAGRATHRRKDQPGSPLPRPVDLALLWDCLRPPQLEFPKCSLNSSLALHPPCPSAARGGDCHSIQDTGESVCACVPKQVVRKGLQQFEGETAVPGVGTAFA